MKWTNAFGVFIGLFLGMNGSSASEHQKKVEVHGHRGARGLFPENTLPAFQSALEAGADVLEMDLAITRDGVLVISHDPFISPGICLHADGSRLQAPILIHSLSLAELKKFDCGSLKNPRFERQKTIPGTQIPTLEKVFDLVGQSSLPHAKKIKFNIETKIFKDHPEYTVEPEEFSKKVVEAFRKSGFLKRIILQSFDERTLIESKRIEPSLQTSMLIDDPKIEMDTLGKLAKADIISPDFDLLTPQRVKDLHQKGFRVIPWTLNRTNEWKKAIEMKIDGIITDYPADLIQYLKREEKK